MDENDEELIRRFSAAALDTFTEDELIDDIPALSVPSRAMPALSVKLSDLRRRYKNLAPVLIVLEEALAKFEFDKHSLEEWKAKYVFPRASSLRRYHREHYGRKVDRGATDGDMIINRSVADVAEWVTGILVPAITSPRAGGADNVFILAGGTGAGKSTLNKYITSVHFEDFVESRIVTSRIEYRKLHGVLANQGAFTGREKDKVALSVRQRAQKYVTACCVRDIFRSAFTRPQRQPDGHTRLMPSGRPNLKIDLRDEDVRGDFLDFYRACFADTHPTDEATLVAIINRAAANFHDPETVKRADWFTAFVNAPLVSETFLAMEIYLAFCAARGIRLFLIFDGFDFIQAADFLKDTTHALVLDTLSRWIIADKGRLTLPVTKHQVRPTIMVTMRSGTVEWFWRDRSLLYGPIADQTFYVAPPELKDIYQVVAARMVREHPEFRDWDPETGLDIFKQIQSGLAKVTGLNQPQVMALFLENTRHRVNYVRHVLEAGLEDALRLERDIPSLTSAELSRGLFDAMGQIASGRNYRLIQVLLQSKNDRFANFIRVERISRWLEVDDKGERALFSAEAVLKDNNIRSGYVGNIFNYHIPYRAFADLEFFLEKVRILHLLQGRALTDTQLRAGFTRNRWRISPYFDISMAILVREALVEGVFDEADGRYRVTPLGRVLSKSLVGQMRYLENVYFGCLLPGSLAIDSVDILRNRAKRIEWVVAAIFHVWILLRLIKTAEAGVREEGEEPAATFLFDAIQPQIEIAVRSIVESEAYRGGLGGPLSERALGLMNRLNARLRG